MENPTTDPEPHLRVRAGSPGHHLLPQTCQKGRVSGPLRLKVNQTRLLATKSARPGRESGREMSFETLPTGGIEEETMQRRPQKVNLVVGPTADPRLATLNL